MNARMTRFLSPPVFEDEETTRVANLVNGILLVCAVGALLLTISSAIASTGESKWLVIAISLTMLLILAKLKHLLQQGRVHLAGTLLSLSVWVSFTIPMYAFDGIRDIAVAGYFLAIVITSLVLSNRTLILFALLASLSIVIAYIAEINGIMITSFDILPSLTDLTTLLITLNATALLIGLTVRRMVRGEEILRRERNKAQRYLDIAGTIIVALNVTGEVTLINRRGREVLGYEHESLIGENWFDTVLPVSIKDQVKNVFDSLMAGRLEPVEYHENAVLTKNGQERIIAWYNTILRDEAGEIMGTLSSGEDITERKRSEEALRESTERLRLALEAARMGTWEWDLVENHVVWSPETHTIFGINTGEFGETYEAYLGFAVPEVRQEVDEKVRTFLDRAHESAVIQYEHEIIRSDGTTGWVEVRGTVFVNKQGQPIRMTGICGDITARKQAEERLKQALAEKTTLLQELYHRTKNNMQVIHALLELRASYVQDEILQAVLEDVQDKIHAMALVHQKLYESRNLSSIDLKEYLDDLTVHLLSSYQVQPNRISLQMEAESISVVIDTAIPCGLVLSELISNALKHAFPGERTGRINIQLYRAEDEAIHLRIADNGVGLPEDFEVRRETSLGLQTVISLVEHQLRGEITVETKCGVAWLIRFRDNLYRSRLRQDTSFEDS